MNVYNLIAIKEISGERVYNAVWNDYAEFFERGEETEVGDIIALDENSEEERYIKATSESKVIVGVHSDTFAHLIGGENPPDGEDFYEYNIKKFIPIGLVGRVRVKFTGKAKVGDYVVPSEIKGVGRVYKDGDNKNNIIGYLVEADNLDNKTRRLKMMIHRGVA